MANITSARKEERGKINRQACSWEIARGLKLAQVHLSLSTGDRETCTTSPAANFVHSDPLAGWMAGKYYWNAIELPREWGFVCSKYHWIRMRKRSRSQWRKLPVNFRVQVLPREVKAFANHRGDKCGRGGIEMCQGTIGGKVTAKWHSCQWLHNYQLCWDNATRSPVSWRLRDKERQWIFLFFSSTCQY